MRAAMLNIPALKDLNTINRQGGDQKSSERGPQSATIKRDVNAPKINVQAPPAEESKKSSARDKGMAPPQSATIKRDPN